MDTGGRDGCARPLFLLHMKSDFMEKLPLPEKFVQQNVLVAESQGVTLFSPFGKYWIMKLSRVGKQIYFDKPWDKFVQFHDIIEGYTLLFCYEGNLVFTAKVFDLNGCLKEYNNIEKYFARLLGQQTNHQSYQTYSDCEDPCNKTEDTSQDWKMKKSQRLRTASFLENIDGQDQTTVTIAVPSTASKATKFQKKISLTELRTKYIRIPKSFSSANKLQNGAVVILKDMKQRESHVFLREYTGDIYFLSKGIEKFIVENNAEVGDRLICELISTGVWQGRILKGCK